jgi:hypothetical protein
MRKSQRKVRRGPSPDVYAAAARSTTRWGTISSMRPLTLRRRPPASACGLERSGQSPREGGVLSAREERRRARLPVFRPRAEHQIRPEDRAEPDTGAYPDPERTGRSDPHPAKTAGDGGNRRAPPRTAKNHRSAAAGGAWRDSEHEDGKASGQAHEEQEMGESSGGLSRAEICRSAGMRRARDRGSERSQEFARRAPPACGQRTGSRDRRGQAQVSAGIG